MKKITQVWMFIALLCSSCLLMAQNEGSDFPNTGSGPSYNLTEGANGFSGTVSTPSDKQDRFQIVLTSGQSITSISASATGGGATGFIQVGNGSVSFPGGNITPVPSSAGTYQVLVSTDFSTGTSWSVTVNVSSSSTPPTAAFFANPTSGCSTPHTVFFTDQSTNIPTSWSWTFGDGSTSTAQNPIHNYTTPGVYTVTLTVSNSGGNDSTTETVRISSPITASISSQTNVSCNGGANGSATATASGGISPYSYSWAPSGGNNATATGLSAGSYTVTVTDDNGCTDMANVTITEPTAVNATITTFTNASCPGAFDGSATVSVSGGVAPFDYQWSNGALTENTNATSNTVTGLGGTTYNVTVTDANGCSDNTTVTITDIDTTPPVANCAAPFTVQLNANGDAAITVNDINNGSTDNCGIASITISQSLFTCADVGDNAVTLTVTDNSGNIDICTTTVTVEDTVAPTITCPAPITVNNDPGECGANVTIPMPTVSDNCSGEAPIGLQFDGTDDYVSAPLPTVFTDIATNDFTIEMWVNIPNSGTIQRLFFAQENSTVFTSLLLNGSNVLYFYVNNTVSVADLGTIPFDSWNHIAARWNATTQSPELFINGTLRATAGGGSSSLGSNNNMTIGARSDGSQVFQGTIDEVRIWNVARSATDIQNNFTDCVDSSNPNLEAYYQLNDGTGSTTVTDASGNGYTGTLVNMNATTAWVEGQVNCSPPITLVNDYNSTDDASDVYPVGTTTVTWTATDSNNNTATCSFDVTVEDTEDPVANCADPFTVQLDANGEASITVADIDNGSTDNCDIDTIAINKTDFSCADVGDNTITLTVTDVNGNSSTCTTIVTVEDNIKPTIVCAMNTTVSTDPGDCYATVSFPQPAVLDNCSVASVTQTAGLPSGSQFPVGTNTIEFTATDANGNSNTCTFDIIVEDNEAPLAVCNSITIQLDEFGAASITAAQLDGGSTDACGVDTITISQDTFDCSNVGDNDVTLTVTDIHGNESTCTAVVTVEDITAPAVVCQDITLQLDANGSVSITGMDIDGGSTDACGIASYDLDIDTFDCSNVGVNPVELTVTDENGNSATCTAMVTVEDNISPDLVCTDFTLELGEDGTATLLAENVIATNEDACGIDTTAVDITEFDCSDIGSPVTVQVFVSDVNGNLSTCLAEVTVVDALEPVISCPADQTVIADSNGSYAIPDYFATGEASVIDNCTNEVTITSQDPAAGELISDGIYTVTLTAEDDNGNIGTCTFELTVESELGVGASESLGSVQLYPNPANNQVTIGNPSSTNLQQAVIYDLTGRVINTVNLTGMGTQKTIDITNLASATYLVIISSENGSITKQLIKE